MIIDSRQKTTQFKIPIPPTVFPGVENYLDKYFFYLFFFYLIWRNAGKLFVGYFFVQAFIHIFIYILFFRVFFASTLKSVNQSCKKIFEINYSRKTFHVDNLKYRKTNVNEHLNIWSYFLAKLQDELWRF